MRIIRQFAGALTVAGMAAFAYAATPSTAIEPTNDSAILAAMQQDQTAPPKPDDKDKDKQDASKPQNDKDAKPPRADKQQMPQKETDRDQQRDRQDKNQPMQAQRGQGAAAGNHGRIRDEDYRTHFGQSHSFSVRTVVTTTRIVPNQTRFVYSGYSFVFLEPWPAGWAMADACYIDYIDGEYVLIDVVHPGMQITLSIVG